MCVRFPIRGVTQLLKLLYSYFGWPVKLIQITVQINGLVLPFIITLPSNGILLKIKLVGSYPPFLFLSSGIISQEKPLGPAGPLGLRCSLQQKYLSEKHGNLAANEKDLIALSHHWTLKLFITDMKISIKVLPLDFLDVSHRILWKNKNMVYHYQISALVPAIFLFEKCVK